MLASAPTVNALEPRERVRGLVAARLFGDVEVPSKIGRFELIRELGAGGMGVVYAAHDPNLERAVALKVLARASDSDRAGRRLLREAQAMARLKHPNVVPVYEVGSNGDQVFIAMELVEGGTLAAWMSGGPRPWREALDMLLPAGRGLAAAHAAGLVHRDFKPANVLIDAEGRARVSDFGLARGGALPDVPADQAEVTAGEDGSLLDGPLTRTGVVLGTPAYMAPEQFLGETATPRSDVFAFCVVLWEAIYGRRPFVADSVGGLTAAIESGTITPPPRSIRAPAWLRGALERGLATRPSDRFASMNELLAALERPGVRRPGLLLALTVGSAVMVAFGIIGLSLLSRPPADPSPLQAGMPMGSWTYNSAVPESVDAAIDCADSQHCTMTRERFAETLARKEAITALVRVMPAVTDGTSHGLRLYGLRPGTVLKALGFKNGDTWTALDGRPLTTLESWDEAMTAASADGEVVITFVRKEEEIELTLRIGDPPK